ncbi:MBL fold metallo-hydrolase [Maritimibacter sp. DP1N21-5]|uniref:MBL fold metallo-hydrolase n=1 Tax=Maritimibacter sp. DP1N21-5 TaxID=2836867 RepID=UPI001C4436D0|nr:MBL fold metallo-hydrolase [Maritimibacter sp. DP1N21-5]MBV7410208.1 MBL fold metallo-hydrolase [Maritimibacter sp. DP1N21-5]
MPILRPTRRDMLRYAAAMPAFALTAHMPHALRAELGPPAEANPAHFRFALGDTNVTIVSDGWFPQPLSSLGMNADEAQKLAFLEAHYLSTEEIVGHTNHVVIDTGSARVLVDVGSGSRFFDTAGRLLSNLETAGIDPASITHVVLTHAHPDHIWGIRDDFDEAIIPDAEYIMGEAEHGYWTEEGLVDRVAPEAQQFVVGAVNSINAEGVEWTLGGDGHEVVPGVKLIATHGHTPGHMSVMVTSGDKGLLVLGDAVTHAYGHFAHPDWYGSMDSDPEATVATRKRLLDMAATDRVPVVGYHFPFPGVGHVMRDTEGAGDAFAFVPALWRF